MNPRTNELAYIPDDATVPDGFEEVPKDLQHAARVKLGSKHSARVSRTSGGKLCKYMAKRRRQIAKQSRKNNR